MKMVLFRHWSMIDYRGRQVFDIEVDLGGGTYTVGMYSPGKALVV